jgi:hypothetical protein
MSATVYSAIFKIFLAGMQKLTMQYSCNSTAMLVMHCNFAVIQVIHYNSSDAIAIQ